MDACGLLQADSQQGGVDHLNVRLQQGPTANYPSNSPPGDHTFGNGKINIQLKETTVSLNFNGNVR